MVPAPITDIFFISGGYFDLFIPRWHGPENTIPERGAYSKRLVGIFEVMQAVVSPDMLEPLGRLRYVSGPVNEGIKEIPKKETGEKGPGQTAYIQ
jgi:hypothetical protein